MPDVELTEADIKNGWTQKDLEKYVAEREKANAETIANTNRPVRPQEQARYRPLRWRE